MDRKPRIIDHRTRIAIMNLLLLCTGEYLRRERASPNERGRYD